MRSVNSDVHMSLRTRNTVMFVPLTQRLVLYGSLHFRLAKKRARLRVLIQQYANLKPFLPSSIIRIVAAVLVRMVPQDLVGITTNLMKHLADLLNKLIIGTRKLKRNDLVPIGKSSVGSCQTADGISKAGNKMSL